MMNTVIGDLALLCLTAGFCMIAFALAKNRRLKQLPIPTAVAFAVFWGVDIFLRTQVNSLTVNLYRTGVSILILTVLWVLMLVLFLKNRTNERSNDENGSQKNDAPHVGL